MPVRGGGKDLLALSCVGHVISRHVIFRYNPSVMGNGHGQFTYTNRENLNRRVGQSG